MAKDLSLTAVAYLRLKAQGDSPLRAMKHAANAIEPICKLAIARHELGRWPSQVEYAEHWKISERRAQRDWADFRRAFPDEQNPERVARWLYSELDARVKDRAVVLSVSVPPDLVAVAA